MKTEKPTYDDLLREVQELRAQADQFRDFYDNAVDGIFQSTPDGTFVKVNPTMARILGYDSPEDLMDSVNNIKKQIYVQPEKREELLSKLKENRPVSYFDVEAYKKDGSMVWVSLHVRPIFVDGKLTCLEGLMEDISNRKESEEELTIYKEHLEEMIEFRTHELRENQDFLQTILDGIQAAIFLLDPENQTIMEANAVATSLTGLPREEIVGKGCHEIGCHQENASECVLCAHDEKVPHKEWQLTRADGKIIPVTKVTLGTTYKGKNCLVEILFDFSERKALERQLTHAQKLESVGQLAAGIAHEINTPIQYVGDNVQFLQSAFDDMQAAFDKYNEVTEAIKDKQDVTNLLKELETQLEEADLEFLSEEIPKALDQAREGTARVTSIVQAMKKFSHPGQDERKAISVNEAIQDTLLVARNEWKYVADIETEYDPAEPLIYGYANDFNQVILNIVVNAAHAISDTIQGTDTRGTITIQTKQEEDTVSIRISDTGKGIPQENIEKIFDPFFTTKEVGKGTGQGLAITYSIVTEKHDGTIEVESSEGKGTAFLIKIPADKRR